MICIFYIKFFILIIVDIKNERKKLKNLSLNYVKVFLRFVYKIIMNLIYFLYGIINIF